MPHITLSTLGLDAWIVAGSHELVFAHRVSHGYRPIRGES
jgi:hypothetical protein